MKIIFKKIKIENFKNFDNLEAEFGSKTYVYGANETGKTSFADAISWCLTGKNSLGDSQFNYIPIGLVGLSPSVTLEIEIEDGNNTKTVTIQRIYQAKQNKSKEFTGEYQTVCYINGLKVGPKEFDKWIEEHICKPEIFRLIHDVRYFTENIAVNGKERPWEAQRRLLFSIVGNKSDIDLARSKKRFEPIMNGLQQYDSANQYLNFLKSEKKSLDDKIRYLNAQISTMDSMLGDCTGCAVDLDYTIERFQIQKRNIETEIEQSRKIQEETRDKTVKELKAQYNDKHKKFREEQEEYSKKRNELIRKKEELTEEKINLNCSLTSTECDLRKVKADYDNIDIQCPTCGQYIPVDMIEQKKKELMDELNIIKMAYDRIKLRKNDVENELEECEKEIKNLGSCPLPNDIQTLLSQIDFYNIPIKPDENLANQLKGIESKLSGLLEKRNEVSENKKIKENIELIESQRKETLDKKAQNSRLMDLCKDFIDDKCKRIEKKINDMFDGITFKMFHQNKTNDEVKPCCDIYWNKTPYNSLSYSTKFVVSMKIALAFQKFYKVEMPIIIDNAESIDLAQEIPIQSIMLIKRDEKCPVCNSEVGRKEADGLFTCKSCGNRLKKQLEIETK